MMNFEDVEERDGEPMSRLARDIFRLSFCRRAFVLERLALIQDRGDQDCRAHFCSLHAFETARRSASCALRARNVQATLSRRSQSVLVSTSRTILSTLSPMPR